MNPVTRPHRSISAASALLCALFALGWPNTGAGQEVPPIEYFTNSPLLLDSGDAELTLSTGERLEDVVVTLRRGRQTESHRFGRVARGHSQVITFEAELGVHEWDVEVSGTWQEQPFELSFDFEFEVTAGVQIEVPLDRINLETQELVLVLNRPVAQVEYDVLSDEGRNMGSGTVNFDAVPAGRQLTVNWEQGPGTVMKITLTAHDTSGFWSQIELIPWSVNIPHEEIHFETGRHDIPEAQAYRIDDAFRQLADAVNRYGQYVDINLYVAGYTDTVGSRSDNQSLSERRARSIAQAFRSRGFDFPVFYQGMGEDGQAVRTADGVDEIQNRRALYILAAQAPLPSSHVPRSNWRALD